MDLNSVKKEYKKGTHRVKTPKETLNQIKDLKPKVGVTRVADITGLDRVGIPVFTSVRPEAKEGAVSIYNGKGITKSEAKASAIMEAIERYSAEYHGKKELRTETYQNLNPKAIDPKKLILPPQIRNVRNAKMKWIKGYDILNEEKIWVPTNSVFHPLKPRNKGINLFKTNTNGLAAGNTKEEAILHGLCELIERDAWSLVEASKKTGSFIEIDEDKEIKELKKRFKEEEIKVLLWDITSDLDIPTVAAVSEDIRKKDPRLLTIGMGTHTDASIALKRSLTEVAQSRLTQIHGAREDATTAKTREKIGIEDLKKRNQYWFEKNNITNLSEIKEKTIKNEDILRDIQHICNKLKKKGFEKVIVIDLTRKEIGIPVVRVIVPGLEVYAIDPSRKGKRCQNARKKCESFSRTKFRS